MKNSLLYSGRKTVSVLLTTALITAMASPAMGQPIPMLLAENTLDQIRAGSTSVHAAADAAATGEFSIAQTSTRGSVRDYFCRLPFSVGYALGGALAIGDTAHADAYTGGVSSSGYVVSTGISHNSSHGGISIAISYHTTVAINF